MKSIELPTYRECLAQSNSLLTCLGVEELDVLVAGRHPRRHRHGQFLFWEGTAPEGLYLVHSGQVKITRTGSDGKEQIMRVAQAGDVFGYLGLLDGSTHAADAVVMEDAVICFMPKAEFHWLMAVNGRFTLAITHELVGALRQTKQQLMEMAHKPVRERLAGTLLHLQRRGSAHQTPGSRLSISRDDLAALVGTARETISRFLSELKAEGTLLVEGSHITLLQPQRLREIATRYD